ncbi:3-phosphoshikimate 1-carboxyvinyltransferase [bacterium]|nr:3-phosphoshikimate 1-carboxyvinyltransferase [bacterium]
MNVNIKPKSFYEGEVFIPSSKSVSHRWLICAALSNKESVIRGNLRGDDLEATADCLRTLGAKIEFLDSCVKVTPIDKKIPKASFNVRESGSTLRFLLPIAAALGVETDFVMAGRLKDRPISPLLSVIGEKGITYNNSPLKISGKLLHGEYKIDASISSQFISGLMFALPLLEGDSEIIMLGDVVSVGYINITLSVLSQCGIIIEKTDYGYYIMGGQSYTIPDNAIAEGDWSSCAFFAVLGALNGDICIHNLHIGSQQGDKEVVELLKEAHADITVKEDSLRIKKSKLKSIRFSAQEVPDLIPAMAIALSCASGTSIIDDVERLKDKESDRLLAVIDMLDSFGIKSYYKNSSLFIEGGVLQGGKVNGYHDHRIVMSATVGALIAKGESIISDKESINKSYPDFFEDIKRVGGEVYES